MVEFKPKKVQSFKKDFAVIALEAQVAKLQKCYDHY
jgi:hypothetical protein